jgi:arsenate reductase
MPFSPVRESLNPVVWYGVKGRHDGTNREIPYHRTLRDPYMCADLLGRFRPENGIHICYPWVLATMRPKVLFLCTGNSARSQMAEGYLRHAAGHRFEALSAGIKPKGLNPLAIEAMREIGIDISRQTSKDVVTLLGQHIPYVVTVCDNAKERCPIFPGTWKFLHWSFEDPAAAQGTHEERLAVFGKIRDQIIAHVDIEFVQGDITRKRA